MTFEECHQQLTAIRRNQGTPTPILKVVHGGTAYQGRLARSDSDPEGRRSKDSPFGVLVLSPVGLVPGPRTILQIGNIPPDGIRDIA